MRKKVVLSSKQGLLIAVSQYLFDAATMSRQNQYLSTLTHRRFMKVNKTSVHGYVLVHNDVPQNKYR